MYIALSVAGVFIVRAGTMETLAIEIDKIIERYPDFTAQHIKAGIWIIEARTIGAAKGKFKNREKSNVFITPDLPLFKLHPVQCELSVDSGEGCSSGRIQPTGNLQPESTSHR